MALGVQNTSRVIEKQCHKHRAKLHGLEASRQRPRWVFGDHVDGAVDIARVAREKHANVRPLSPYISPWPSHFALLAVDDLVPPGEGLVGPLEVDLVTNLAKGGRKRLCKARNCKFSPVKKVT